MVSRQHSVKWALLQRSVTDVERPGTRKPTVLVKRVAENRARRQTTCKETAIIAGSRVIKRPNVGSYTLN